MMAARLGHVIYWIACAWAAAFLLFCLLISGTAYLTNDSVKYPWTFERTEALAGLMLIGLVVAAISWGIGRAACYVLAGK